MKTLSSILVPHFLSFEDTGVVIFSPNPPEMFYTQRSKYLLVSLLFYIALKNTEVYLTFATNVSSQSLLFVILAFLLFMIIISTLSLTVKSYHLVSGYYKILSFPSSLVSPLLEQLLLLILAYKRTIIELLSDASALFPSCHLLVHFLLLQLRKCFWNFWRIQLAVSFLDDIHSSKIIL